MNRSNTYQPTMTPRQLKAWEALERRRFFKLICGASFTEAIKAGQLAAVYAEAGCDCVDIAADPLVVAAVTKALNSLPQQVEPPLLMVSLNVDGDPHFRKVVVEEEGCIACDACVPSCPTEALTMGATVIKVAEPLCYGCNRCVPVCPTDALITRPLEQLPELLEACLTHPQLEAVELHANSLDEEALTRFYKKVGPLLRGKLVSLCFRVPEHTGTNELKETLTIYLDAFEQLSNNVGVTACFLQIDGKPMTGEAGRSALSLPALNSAAWLLEENLLPSEWPVTISGGINEATARWLRKPTYQAIAGVGMGSVARKAVWSMLEGTGELHQAVKQAHQVVEAFQQGRAAVVN